MNNSGTSGDIAGPLRLLNIQNPTTDFLFVNQTSNSLAYKAGDCQFIRSHVRKHAARHLRQNHSKHKGRKKVATERQCRPPVSRGSGQYTSEYLIHDANCPTAHLNRSWLSWLSSQDSDPGLRRPDINSGIGSYCKACGSQSNVLIRQRTPENKELMRSPRQSRQALTDALLELSPVEVLGAGRVDPFSSCPVEKPDRAMHEALDHQLNYLLPGLVPDEVPIWGPKPANSTSMAMISAALKSPLLFDAMIFTAICHRNILYLSKSCPNSPQALPYKLRMIQRLKERISNTSEAVRDEFIWSIMALAFNESINVTTEKRRPFNTPLRKARWINVYGNIEAVPEHMKAVLDIISLRGGINNLKLCGLAEIIDGGDVLSAINRVSKPVLPPLHSHETYIASLKSWATSPARVQILATAFWRLTEYGLTDSMLQGLDLMGALTMAFDDYIQGRPDGLTFEKTLRAKAAVQKRFLLLPTSAELNITPLAKAGFYESCRLTAIIFSIASFYPLPNTYAALQIAIQRLKSTIILSDIESYGAERSGVLLWILVLGGIAALDKPERSWFVSQLARLVQILMIEWEEAEGVLETFLWFEIACSPGGRLLWDEALNLGV